MTDTIRISRETAEVIYRLASQQGGFTDVQLSRALDEYEAAVSSPSPAEGEPDIIPNALYWKQQWQEVKLKLKALEGERARAVDERALKVAIAALEVIIAEADPVDTGDEAWAIDQIKSALRSLPQDERARAEVENRIINSWKDRSPADVLDMIGVVIGADDAELGWPFCQAADAIRSLPQDALERCAQIADKKADSWRQFADGSEVEVAEEIAAEIRALRSLPQDERWRDVVIEACTLVDLWRQPKIAALARAERNAAIEDTRVALIGAVEVYRRATPEKEG